MTRDNQPQISNSPLQDFDAVSLYPSAMNRLWIQTGIPVVIESELIDQINSIESSVDKIEFIQKCGKMSSYVVDIEITKVNRILHFPLLVKHDRDTKTNVNTNDCGIYRVDDIYLEDLVQFQQIEFKIKRGYRWSGIKDYQIQSFIKHVFDMRLKYKSLKNPLQLVYKLIMNSSYGKTIQRPIDTVEKYMSIYNQESEDKFNNFIVKNYQQIASINQIDGSKTKHIVLRKSTSNSFGLTLFGVHILSMSRRIMNEVFDIAESLELPIYYQDTDSLHINDNALDRLSKAYESKYGRKLIGSDMNQFHSDFTSDNGRTDVVYAIESIFLGKKMYCDKLLLNDGSVDYMSRMKGVGLDTVRLHAKLKGISLWDLYLEMLDGIVEAFDLTLARPCFDMKNTLSISTRQRFIRRVGIKKCSLRS
jgi:hypothetical protein